jgi:hypothetical protein
MCLPPVWVFLLSFEYITSFQSALLPLRFFWVGTFFCVLWATATIVTSIIVFTVTKSYFSFLISSGSAVSIEFVRRLANYLFPIDEKNFQLKKLKIQMKMKTQKDNSEEKTRYC